MASAGKHPIVLWSALCLLCLAWNGCLDTVTPSAGIRAEFLPKDSGEINPAGHFHLASANGISLKGVLPSQPVDYWEARITWDTGGVYVYDASVDSCANREIPCPGPIADYRTTEGETRWNPLGPTTHTYFVGWTGTSRVVWNDDDAVRSFLGRIDSEADALNWATHQGYGSDSVYIQEVTGGFELLINRMDHMCNPYRLVRTRVIMHYDGRSEEIARATLVESHELCVQN
jgi:hypothetical protein